MNEIITIKREDLKLKLEEYFKLCPEHVFLMDFVPAGETTIFEMFPETEFSAKHIFYCFLDDSNKINEPVENKLTSKLADDIQNFIFYIRNLKLDREKRLIIACNNGRTVSGAIALWAMDWLMGDQMEEELYKLNPDIKPNENILRDLYLHPII